MLAFPLLRQEIHEAMSIKPWAIILKGDGLCSFYFILLFMDFR